MSIPRMYRPRVYIAGPISIGNVEQNVRRACEVGRILIEHGYAPLIPQLTAYLAGPKASASGGGVPHDVWLDVDFQWVAVADAVLRITGNSKGADAEVAYAREHDIPVFFSLAGLLTNEQNIEPPASEATVAGVGPDAPTVVSSNGAKQSGTNYRADLLPARATLAVAAVLKHGAAKYGDNNWRGLTVDDHINHALIHMFAYLAGDRQDDHLSHAACRALMAVDTDLLRESATPATAAN